MCTTISRSPAGYMDSLLSKIKATLFMTHGEWRDLEEGIATHESLADNYPDAS